MDFLQWFDGNKKKIVPYEGRFKKGGVYSDDAFFLDNLLPNFCCCTGTVPVSYAMSKVNC